MDATQRLQTFVGIRSLISDKLNAAMHSLSRTGDIETARVARRSAEAGLKEAGNDMKALLATLEAAPTPPPMLPKVRRRTCAELGVGFCGLEGSYSEVARVFMASAFSSS